MWKYLFLPFLNHAMVWFLLLRALSLLGEFYLGRILRSAQAERADHLGQNSILAEGCSTNSATRSEHSSRNMRQSANGSLLTSQHVREKDGQGAIMIERRKEERYRRRLQLRLSTENGSTMGFTDDISREGIFVRSASVQPVGTPIRMELTTPDNEKVVLGGTVQWEIKLSPILLRQGKKGGMGIKISNFVSGEESYRKILESCEEQAENEVSAL